MFFSSIIMDFSIHYCNRLLTICVYDPIHLVIITKILDILLKIIHITTIYMLSSLIKYYLIT